MVRLLAAFIIILELSLKMSRNKVHTENIGIKDLFKEFYLGPFSYYKDKNKINNICERYNGNNYKISNSYKKFSVFINQKIFDGRQVIRDYKQAILYIKNNNPTFQHEHIIYTSDYFVQKLIKN